MGLCYGINWYQNHATRNSEISQDSTQPGSASGIIAPDTFHFPISDFQPNDDYPPFLPSDPGLDDLNQESEYDWMDIGDGEIFTESFPGCSDLYPGGVTFMDLFWQDKHAEERQENLYFPFASGKEWQFSSWCLRSGLSMAGIDTLLSLSMVSNRYFRSEP